MKILAIDTSTSIFSLCLKINNHDEIIEYEAGVTHSKIILQEIKSILKKCDLVISDLDAIAFSSGPGSFTGIRIASGVAYGLAFPYKIPIVPVSSLEVIASMAGSKYIMSTIDARMDQIYLQIFRTKANKKNFSPLTKPQVLGPSELPKLPQEIQNNLTIIGTGYELYKEQFNDAYQKIDFLAVNVQRGLSAYVANLADCNIPKEFSLKEIFPQYVRNRVAYTIEERKLNENHRK